MTGSKGSGLQKFYDNLRQMRREAEKTAVDLKRYARLSFDFDVQQQVANGSIRAGFILRPNSEFSRCHLPIGNFELGVISFGYSPQSNPVYFGKLVGNRNDLRAVGFGLRELIAQFESEPSDAAKLIKWAQESYDGANKPLVPVAIHGVDYFSQLNDRAGNPFCSSSLLTYRSNDFNSKSLIDLLCR